MKIFKRLMAIAAAITFVIVLSGFTEGENRAAGVIEDFGCGLFDGYGNVTVTTESIAVTNFGGNVMLTCHAEGVPTPGTVFKADGFWCGTPWGITNLTWAVVSSEGDSMLKCMIKKPKD